MTDQKFEWFACYPTKILARLIGMSTNQAMIYLVTVMRIYEEDGPCFDSARALGQRAGMAPRVAAAALKSLLKTGILWEAKGGGLMESDALNELIARHERTDDRAEFASRSSKIPKTNQRRRTTQSTDNRSPHLFGGESRARGEATIPSASLADWTPPEEYFINAEAEFGLTPDEVRAEAEKFRNHYLAKGVSWPNPTPKFKNWLFQSSIYKIQDQLKASRNEGPDFYDVAMGRHNGHRQH